MADTKPEERSERKPLDEGFARNARWIFNFIAALVLVPIVVLFVLRGEVGYALLVLALALGEGLWGMRTLQRSMRNTGR